MRDEGGESDPMASRQVVCLPAGARRHKGKHVGPPHALLLGQHPKHEVNGEEDGQQAEHHAWHVKDRFAVAHAGSRSSALGTMPPASTPTGALTTLTTIVWAE